MGAYGEIRHDGYEDLFLYKWVSPSFFTTTRERVCPGER